MVDVAGISPNAVDLTNCDREPIHVPGSIQPHGLLLAVDPATLRVVQWSENAPEVLGVATDSLAGEPLDGLIDAKSISLIRMIVADGTDTVSGSLRSRFLKRSGDEERLGSAHLYQGALIVEFEVAVSAGELIHVGAGIAPPSVAHRLRQSMEVLHATETMEDLFDSLAREVRSLNGFDRVMVYRFARDGHGEVVGEARAEHLESFLGLHYPATDIPSQARRLYSVNTIRLIADINAKSVRIIPTVCPLHGRPLDLTYSTFRSVSPIHIEYLQNMGVAASMSISIMKGRELWGLIACHHDSPRAISYELRAGCDLLGTMAGTLVTTRVDSSEVEELGERRASLAAVLQSASAATALRKGLIEAAPRMRSLIDASGVAVCLDGEIQLDGITPPLDQIRKIRDEYSNHHSKEIEFTHTWNNRISRESDMPGVMMVPIGLESSQMLLFFRPEFAYEVRWAGNPQKPAEFREDGIRLSPRKSFAQWKETVSGQSREWSAIDQTVARELKSGLAILVSRRVTELVRVNGELERVNADLNSFTYSASHDLKEPLRRINQSLFFLKESLRGLENPETTHRLETVQQNTRHLEELLEALLRMSRVGQRDLHVDYCSLKDVAMEAAEIVRSQFSGTAIDFQIAELPHCFFDFLLVRDLFTNIFSNAVKYNRSEVRRIEVFPIDMPVENRSATTHQCPVVIAIRDNGIGIATHHSGSVFEVFRRLNSPGEFGGGTGAGLAIAKRIVQRHGGKLWVESTEGTGSTFYFQLAVESDGRF